MQTFLPYADFAQSAAALDDKRLGKQRVECDTLLSGGWPSHPASLMWRGFEQSLHAYMNAICAEWERRGHENNYPRLFVNPDGYEQPWWLGWEDFHVTHRSRLFQKDKVYYKQWACEPVLDYIWPLDKDMMPNYIWEDMGENRVQFAFPARNSLGEVWGRRPHSVLSRALGLARDTVIEIIIDGKVKMDVPCGTEMFNLCAALVRNYQVGYNVWHRQLSLPIKLSVMMAQMRRKKLDKELEIECRTVFCEHIDWSRRN